MLASMSEIDPRADTPLVDCSELDVSGLLPTGTVTLLLADVEGFNGFRPPVLAVSERSRRTGVFGRTR